MGMIDDQYDKMRGMAVNDQQLNAIDGAQELTHSIANGVGNVVKGIFSSPEPPPPPKSSGNPALALLGLGLLGGLYVYDKFFGGDDKTQQNKK